MIHMHKKQLLKIENISKSFKHNKVLDGICLEVEQGQVCGLMGINGTGKSTLFKIVAGLERADSGKVLYLGQPKTDNQNFGIMIENPNFFGYMTGEENLRALGMLYDNVSKDDIKNALGIVGLLSVSQKFDQYSLGMKQRLYFAFAILSKPKILLLDEPFTGIDFLSVELLSKLIQNMAQQGVGVLISGHQLEQMQSICDKICLLNQGKIVKEIVNVKGIDIKQEFSELVGVVMNGNE